MEKAPIEKFFYDAGEEGTRLSAQHKEEHFMRKDGLSRKTKGKRGGSLERGDMKQHMWPSDSHVKKTRPQHRGSLKKKAKETEKPNGV